MIHYGFYCQPQLSLQYNIFATVCGILGIMLPWQNWFNQRKHKLWRVGFFLSLCLSGLVPFAHMALKYGGVKTLKFFCKFALFVL